jgi:SpoVK/Ycf46/Vps4 family AAA+-type ATPase
VCVQIPELVKGDVGGSEAAISAVFAKAREFAPSLLFLDELQAMFGARPSGECGGGGGGGAHKSLAQLLIEIDLCKSAAPYQRVALVGATNVPDALDPSLLQPGRFEHVLLIGPPDRAARAEILASALCRVPLAVRADSAGDSSSTGVVLAAEILAEACADRTDGFSAADLRSLCHAAVYRAIGEGATSLDACHLEQALQVFQPSITPEMMDKLYDWEARFHSS